MLSRKGRHDEPPSHVLCQLHLIKSSGGAGQGAAQARMHACLQQKSRVFPSFCTCAVPPYSLHLLQTHTPPRLLIHLKEGLAPHSGPALPCHILLNQHSSTTSPWP